MPVLEVGPGMGVLSQYLLEREDVDLKMVEIDTESVNYLLTHFSKANGRLVEADFLRLKLENFFKGEFCVIGNFPYNISSQIFFKILDYKEQVPQVVCMIQKEVAERIAEKPGTKTYGILSVLLQAWYDIEYLFTVGEGGSNPPAQEFPHRPRMRRETVQDHSQDEFQPAAQDPAQFSQTPCPRNGGKAGPDRRANPDLSLRPGVRPASGAPRGRGLREPYQQVLKFADCLVEHAQPLLIGMFHPLNGFVI